MLPTYHTGDLVLVRSESSYHVGQVIAYRIPKGDTMAGAQVIHRIIGGNAAHGFVVQGDNRTAPDSWRPKPRDIDGAALGRIPYGVFVIPNLPAPLMLALLSPAFLFVYLCSMVIFSIGAWDQAHHYNLEPPLVALLLGLVIANVGRLPAWMDSGFRVEYYIKTGIVLLGATLPFTLVIWAGPVAIVQASIVSITTFMVIYFVAKKMGLDRRLAATLGAGGAVCGVSGAIAIAGAVGAKKEHAPVAITMVIGWAIVMIFFLPLVSRALSLHTGIAGAWIGTSEFADAAGFAAAQAYGNLAGHVAGIQGTPDNAVWGFTLMKVVGRDIWIGIWAFVMAIIATTRWEVKGGTKPGAGEIWYRFPKFVIGFAIASALMTLIAARYGAADYNKVVKPDLVGPILSLRTWAFIFCFFSIGLTTRFRELAHAGSKPFWAFTSGVVVNVLLGFILSTVVFASYWTNLSH